MLLILLLTSLSQAAELPARIQTSKGVAAEELVVWSEKGVPGKPSELTIVQRGKNFTPAVIAVRKGSSLRFENLDSVAHNAFGLKPKFDLGMHLPKESAPSQKFPDAGRIHVFCNIHPDMHLIVNVLEHGSFARPAPDGSFRLPWKGAPPKELVAFVDGPEWKEPVRVIFRQEGGALQGTLPEAIDQGTPRHQRKDGSRYPEARTFDY